MTRHVRVIGDSERHAWRTLGLLAAAGVNVHAAHTQPDSDGRTSVHALITLEDQP